MLWYLLSVYFAVVSLFSAVITVYDKIAAIRGKTRIPEKSLLLAGAAGGALVMYAVMRAIGHKTRHKKFMIGLPIMIIIQLLLFVLLLKSNF